MEKEIRISWGRYGELTDILVRKVQDSGEKFDMVIGVVRGGLIPAIKLSYGLGDIPMAAMAAQSYNRRQRQKSITFSRHLTMVSKEIGKRCLLVDDLVDTGRTLKESIRFLKRKYGPKIKKIKTAVIFVKSGSTFQPDFYVKKTGEEWVKFWYENLVPKQKEG